MILRFKPGYFIFPEESFSIRRGIKLRGVGEAILVGDGQNKFAKVTEVSYIRLCDLLEDQELMRSWHLYGVGDPYETIKDCYPTILDKEIVTIVWLVIE